MRDRPAAPTLVTGSRHWWFDPNPRGTVEGYTLILFGTISAVWAIVVIGLLGASAGEALLLATVYALPVCLLVALLLSLRLAWVGGSPVPVLPAALGVAYVAGGAAFDLYATVLHSPTLDREGNPVARALLDSGHELGFVYDYAFTTQLLLVLTVSTLWIALLRHRDAIVAATGRPSSPGAFLKAATGGGHLTWRQWILPRGPAEFPHPYHVFWIAAIAFVAGAIDRWYVALEWFGLVPPVRLWVLAAAMISGPVAYFAWLWKATRARDSAGDGAAGA